MTRGENIFKDFAEAYKKVIEDIQAFGNDVIGVKDIHSVGSEFGTKNRLTKEILAYSFTVSNVRSRFLYSHRRQLKKQYALASFFWTLLGTRRPGSILPFNSRGKVFLSESGDLPSAIGPHVFKLRDGRYSGFERVLALLSLDPSSRRAVVQFLSNSDLTKKLRDVPCYNFIQFFVRENLLYSHVVMRSQNALMLLPYDFYLFSMLHEAMSVRLNIQPGAMHYTCSSIHIYEDDLKFAQDIIADPIEAIEHESMINFSNETIESLKHFFRDLSSSYLNNSQVTIDNIEQYGLDQYWESMIVSHFK